MKRLLTSIFTFGALVSGLCQSTNLPTLFVAPLEADTSEIRFWQPALGSGLAEMFITEIGKMKKFDVLESTALENLKDEIKLGDDGFVGKDEKVEKGGWAGADYMFRGKVTRFGAKSQSVGLGGFAPGGLGNLGLKQNKTDVQIDWRLVDVTTRKIVKTGKATAAETGVGFNVGVAVGGAGGNIGFNNKEFMDSALGKATVKALAIIMAELKDTQVAASGRQLAKASAAQKAQDAANAALTALRNTPGKVLAVINKTTVIVTLGSKQGFKAGDKLKLYEVVDTKDDKGAVVFSEEKLAGEVTLDNVQDEKSKATYSGTAEVKSGWVVKAN
jgi:curli biogenesis system outer membrane secretion channel CsgG